MAGDKFRWPAHWILCICGTSTEYMQIYDLSDYAFYDIIKEKALRRQFSRTNAIKHFSTKKTTTTWAHKKFRFHISQCWTLLTIIQVQLIKFNSPGTGLKMQIKPNVFLFYSNSEFRMTLREMKFEKTKTL